MTVVKYSLMSFIYDRSNSTGITIMLGGKAQRSLGMPREEFVTTQTILYDLNKLGIPPQKLEELMSASIKANKKQRQLDDEKRKAEEEKRTKLEKEREEKRVKLEKEQNEAKRLEEQERIKKELEAKLEKQRQLKELSETEAKTQIFPDKYKEWIKVYLKKSLFDPYSVKDLDITDPLKFTFKSDTFEYKEGQTVWFCFVSYNAKNKMGAYTGLKDYTFFFRDGKLDNVMDGKFFEVGAK